MNARIKATLVGGLVWIGALAAGGAVAAPAAGLTHVNRDEIAQVRGLTADYVRTPNGYFHASCVQHIQPGEQLLRDGNIERPDGTVRQVAGCAYPHFLRSGLRVEASDGAIHLPTIYNGYLQLVSTTLATGSNRLRANMTVPANPKVQLDQTLYLFPGLEDGSNVVTILQPVLGWNGYGANNWTIASWNCCKDGTIYVGNNVVVQPGDLIVGNMVHNAGQNWTITAIDRTRPTLPAATLRTSSYGQVFNWVFAAALETYGVRVCGQFPGNSPTRFTSIQAYVGGAPVNNPVWGIQAGTDPMTRCTGAQIVGAKVVNITY